MPLLVTEHSSTAVDVLVDDETRALYRRLVAPPARLVAVSRTLARDLARALGVGENVIDVLPNAVPVDAFPPGPAAGRDAADLLYVGSRKASKGIETLLRAFGEVHSRRPTVRLRLIGPPGQPAEEARWAAVIGELGVADSVSLEPSAPRESVAEAMRHATLFVTRASTRPSGWWLPKRSRRACRSLQRRREVSTRSSGATGDWSDRRVNGRGGACRCHRARAFRGAARRPGGDAGCTSSNGMRPTPSRGEPSRCTTTSSSRRRRGFVHRPVPDGRHGLGAAGAGKPARLGGLGRSDCRSCWRWPEGRPSSASGCCHGAPRPPDDRHQPAGPVRRRPRSAAVGDVARTGPGAVLPRCTGRARGLGEIARRSGRPQIGIGRPECRGAPARPRGAKGNAPARGDAAFLGDRRGRDPRQRTIVAGRARRRRHPPRGARAGRDRARRTGRPALARRRVDSAGRPG